MTRGRIFFFFSTNLDHSTNHYTNGFFFFSQNAPSSIRVDLNARMVYREKKKNENRSVDDHRKSHARSLTECRGPVKILRIGGFRDWKWSRGQKIEFFFLKSKQCRSLPLCGIIRYSSVYWILYFFIKPKIHVMSY